MFKVKNNIAPREFLQEVYETEGVGAYYREIVRNIMKDEPFAISYEVSDSTIIEAYTDEDVCTEWKNRLKKQFRIEKSDGLFEFGKEFKLTPTSSPLMIANTLLTPHDEYQGKCLIVRDNYEVIIESVNLRTILKFKKKW
jgi:hypothetical protein